MWCRNVLILTSLTILWSDSRSVDAKETTIGFERTNEAHDVGQDGETEVCSSCDLHGKVHDQNVQRQDDPSCLKLTPHGPTRSVNGQADIAVGLSIPSHVGQASGCDLCSPQVIGPDSPDADGGGDNGNDDGSDRGRRTAGLKRCIMRSCQYIFSLCGLDAAGTSEASQCTHGVSFDTWASDTGQEVHLVLGKELTCSPCRLYLALVRGRTALASGCTFVHSEMLNQSQPVAPSTLSPDGVTVPDVLNASASDTNTHGHSLTTGTRKRPRTSGPDHVADAKIQRLKQARFSQVSSAPHEGNKMKTGVGQDRVRGRGGDIWGWVGRGLSPSTFGKSAGHTGGAVGKSMVVNKVMDQRGDDEASGVAFRSELISRDGQQDSPGIGRVVLKEDQSRVRHGGLFEATRTIVMEGGLFDKNKTGVMEGGLFNEAENTVSGHKVANAGKKRMVGTGHNSKPKLDGLDTWTPEAEIGHRGNDGLGVSGGVLTKTDARSGDRINPRLRFKKSSHTRAIVFLHGGNFGRNGRQIASSYGSGKFEKHGTLGEEGIPETGRVDRGMRGGVGRAREGPIGWSADKSRPKRQISVHDGSEMVEEREDEESDEEDAKSPSSNEETITVYTQGPLRMDPGNETDVDNGTTNTTFEAASHGLGAISGLPVFLPNGSHNITLAGLDAGNHAEEDENPANISGLSSGSAESPLNTTSLAINASTDQLDNDINALPYQPLPGHDDDDDDYEGDEREDKDVRNNATAEEDASTVDELSATYSLVTLAPDMDYYYDQILPDTWEQESTSSLPEDFLEHWHHPGSELEAKANVDNVTAGAKLPIFNDGPLSFPDWWAATSVSDINALVVSHDYQHMGTGTESNLKVGMVYEGQTDASPTTARLKESRLAALPTDAQPLTRDPKKNDAQHGVSSQVGVMWLSQALVWTLGELVGRPLVN